MAEEQCYVEIEFDTHTQMFFVPDVQLGCSVIETAWQRIRDGKMLYERRRKVSGSYDSPVIVNPRFVAEIRQLMEREAKSGRGRRG
jgi:hypothetical protein